VPVQHEKTLAFCGIFAGIFSFFVASFFFFVASFGGIFFTVFPASDGNG
jgi:hypothetical protein